MARGRFRRALLGYRTSEVDSALADAEAVVAETRVELESAFADANAVVAASRAELESWRRAVEERDAAIAERDQEIRELDGVAEHLSRIVVERGRELEALRGQIDDVLVQARGYATRVRMQALRHAVAIAGSANGNGRGGVGERTAVAAGEHRDAAEDEAAAETAAAAPESTFGVRPTAPLDLFEGLVQLEIGPLTDFSQLVGFEDAARAVAPASEISVTRFSQGRATLDLRLAQPVDLLRELGERSPFEFEVRSLRDGRLILDLTTAKAA